MFKNHLNQSGFLGMLLTASLLAGCDRVTDVIPGADTAAPASRVAAPAAASYEFGFAIVGSGYPATQQWQISPTTSSVSRKVATLTSSGYQWYCYANPTGTGYGTGGIAVSTPGTRYVTAYSSVLVCTEWALQVDFQATYNYRTDWLRASGGPIAQFNWATKKWDLPNLTDGDINSDPNVFQRSNGFKLTNVFIDRCGRNGGNDNGRDL